MQLSEIVKEIESLKMQCVRYRGISMQLQKIEDELKIVIKCGYEIPKTKIQQILEMRSYK